jgi:hypothetical protein
MRRWDSINIQNNRKESPRGMGPAGLHFDKKYPDIIEYPGENWIPACAGMTKVDILNRH